MALLPYEASGFPRTVKPSGTLKISRAQLVCAALTVGSPYLVGPRRPLIEMLWRGALVGANLHPYGGQWSKTTAYSNLDPSEKSAVSYFLGMTQAQVTCDFLLGMPYLVHLDHVLALLGRSTGKSRPDFVAMDVFGTIAAAVEAKGRTHGYTAALVAKAKAQADLLPSVSGLSAASIASVAWFDHDGSWQAVLADPPRRRNSNSDVTAAAMRFAFYQPIVESVGDMFDREDVGGVTTAHAPGLDAQVSLPTAIFDLLAEYPCSRSVDAAVVEEVGAAILAVVTEPPPKVRSDNPERTAVSAAQVGVSLGETWWRDDEALDQR